MLQSIDDCLCRALRGEPAAWSAIEASVTPEEFLDRARHHGVQALLFHCLSRSDGWSDWPVEIRQGLEADSKAGVAQEMLHAHYLAKLLQQFTERGIRCLLIKGEAMALTHYATPGTRARSDCDLFIDLADLPVAQEAVTEAGFSIVSPVYKTHQFTAVRTAGAAGAMQFDVHWRISNNARFARLLQFDEAFGRADKSMDAENARILGAADALLLACVHRHGSEWHDRNRLIWLYDIHLLARQMSTAQLRDFAADAVRRNVQGVVLDGLLATRQRFLSDIPSETIAALETPETPISWSGRLRESNLGLLVDDWRILPAARSKRDLLTELLLPSGAYLLHKYQKRSKLWLPVLYLWQISTGVLNRLLLR